MLSCTKSPNSESDSDGQLFIKVLDAPANFQQLNISINQVWIHRTGADANIGWSTVSTEPVDVDLLSLRNGKSEQLVLNTAPAGKYNQIKLRFGTCTVVENGMESPLYLNTAPLFEYILNYDFEVMGGKRAQLTFDFNLSQSIHKSGIKDYSFTPVIRVQNTLLSGSISGSVFDSKINADSSRNIVLATISTWTGIDSVSTYNDTTSGHFQLSDLPEKSYSVRIIPFDTISFHERRIDSAVVVRQTKTYLGAVVLQRR
jgi:hypothetical protein